jgi:hypothetical protein
MRFALFASWLALACDTEPFELVGFPDAAGFEDAAGEDAAAEDAAAPDATDTGTPDAGMPDMGTPDSGSACTCRYVACTADPECEAEIGAGSTCNTVDRVCEGAIGSCAVDSDCGNNPRLWRCTMDRTSLDSC